MKQGSYQSEDLVQVQSIQEVDEITKRYFKPDTLTNNYILLEEYKKYIQTKVLFAWIGLENAFFLVQKDGFYRLYYFLNDSAEKFHKDISVDIVTEILFRGPKRFPENEVSYWTQQGFKKHLQRDAYALSRSNLEINESSDNSKGVAVKPAKGSEDVDFIKNAITHNLDYHTGDILSNSEIKENCQNDDVWIVLVDEQAAGFLQASLKNKVYWLEHIVIDQKYRGRGLSKLLMHSFFRQGIAKDCRSFQLWVINENHAAVSLYRKYGFQYLNKSTLSLLKLHHE